MASVTSHTLDCIAAATLVVEMDHKPITLLVLLRGTATTILFVPPFFLFFFTRTFF
jgi:hypothetical protein